MAKGKAVLVYVDPKTGRSYTDAAFKHPVGGLTTYFENVLIGIGAPITTANMNALAAWQAAEGGSSKNNPLNTTQPAPGATNYNSVGVKNYPDAATGIRATVQTLLNGNYNGIVAALRKGKNPYDVANQSAELHTWGTGAGVKRVLDSWFGGNTGNALTQLHVPGAAAITGAVTGTMDAGYVAAGGVETAVKAIPDLIAVLLKANTWVRVAYVVGGMGLIVVGAFLLEHEVVAGIVPGAAAGAGAGKAIEAAAVAA